MEDDDLRSIPEGLLYATEEDYQAALKARRDEIRQRDRDRYKDRANLPKWARKTLDDLTGVDALDMQDLRTFVDEFVAGQREGRGLLLAGPPGVDKTTMACAVLNECLQHTSHDLLGRDFVDGKAKRPGYFTSYGGLLDLYALSWKDDEADVLRRSIFGNGMRPVEHVRLLVIDDLGHEHDGGSGFTTATLHRLLRERFDKGYPTIITTNLDPVAPSEGTVSDLEKRYDRAVHSFLLGQAFTPVDVVGEDRRK